MKKTIIAIVIISLMMQSCSRYTSPGQGGCYFKQTKFKTNKQIVRI